MFICKSKDDVDPCSSTTLISHTDPEGRDILMTIYCTRNEEMSNLNSDQAVNKNKPHFRQPMPTS